MFRVYNDLKREVFCGSESACVWFMHDNEPVDGRWFIK